MNRTEYFIMEDIIIRQKNRTFQCEMKMKFDLNPYYVNFGVNENDTYCFYIGTIKISTS